MSLVTNFTGVLPDHRQESPDHSDENCEWYAARRGVFYFKVVGVWVGVCAVIRRSRVGSVIPLVDFLPASEEVSVEEGGLACETRRTVGECEEVDNDSYL